MPSECVAIDFLERCTRCGTEWTSDGHTRVCPKCGHSYAPMATDNPASPVLPGEEAQQPCPDCVNGMLSLPHGDCVPCSGCNGTGFVSPEAPSDDSAKDDDDARGWCGYVRALAFRLESTPSAVALIADVGTADVRNLTDLGAWLQSLADRGIA